MKKDARIRDKTKLKSVKAPIVKQQPNELEDLDRKLLEDQKSFDELKAEGAKLKRDLQSQRDDDDEWFKKLNSEYGLVDVDQKVENKLKNYKDLDHHKQ